MRPSVAALVASSTLASAKSLADVCTLFNVKSALPSNGTLLGINVIPSATTAGAVYNASSMGSSDTFNYCNVTVTYTHPGKGDSVVIEYAFPEPSDFKNRFYVAGGFGYSLSSTSTGGISYGAVGGATSAGYGALDGVTVDEVFLYGNGSINWDATYMFAYQALGEMTQLGKHITSDFYSTDSKIYTYYEGCSDGGRQGMSQIQRWGAEYDGVITGAPAFRYGQQQVNHLFSAVVEQTKGYYPPPCEMEKIVNATIKACDPLDGRADGVISRSDLCKLNFNLTSIIGENYYCAAETSTSLGFNFGKRAIVKRSDGTSTSYQPAQNGSVSAEGVAVAQAVYDGLFDSNGDRAYLSYQVGASFTDAETEWNNNTKEWGLDIPSTGGEFVARFIELQDLSNLSDLDGVTYDTLVGWMNEAMTRYMDSLQTTIPDLTTFQAHGGKLLHYHGESDPSVPTASSIHYWQSVRSIMYPGLTERESIAKLRDWYQLYLIPGAAHCATNSLQPGPYPENNMETMIDWVENGIKPSRLNATVSSGEYSGEVQRLCQWPSRPLWSSNSAFDCVTDRNSYESWTYEFPAFKVPVY
ncbi:Tannase/feruloyl esterase [Penicillium frequentans]|uniref:Carboxylic ester hydrolase n=1 Tax=Penicillium frequentans TaxID=3151616 RepID=A0AAD6D6D7_9EURO|nr:Tannase/feruloyl esterase [Penicillium glabrum]